MQHVRLVRGTDVFDARTLPTIKPEQAKQAVKLDDGREVPKYVFVSLNATGQVDTALRGMAVEVPDDVAEELLTLPGYSFEVVDPETAKIDQYRLTLTRNMFGQFIDPRTGEVVDLPSLDTRGATKTAAKEEPAKAPAKAEK